MSVSEMSCQHCLSCNLTPPRNSEEATRASNRQATAAALQSAAFNAECWFSSVQWGSVRMIVDIFCNKSYHGEPFVNLKYLCRSDIRMNVSRGVFFAVTHALQRRMI